MIRWIITITHPNKLLSVSYAPENVVMHASGIISMWVDVKNPRTNILGLESEYGLMRTSKLPVLGNQVLTGNRI